MTTNTKEGGLEAIIVNHLRDVNGYVEGTSDLYSKDEAIVKSWLETFLVATQPDKVARSMCFASASEKAKFSARLCEALAKRGVTDVLRKGFSFNGTTFDLYFPLPSEQNPSAKEAYEKNCFGVIRQLHYSKIDPNDAIDFVVFVNGLPLATFELKNHYTRQTVENAIRQYQTDRNPKEVLLKPKRCAVHFAVDDTDVYMCTELKGAESWFLPFNRGVNGGAGNPPGAGVPAIADASTNKIDSVTAEDGADVEDGEKGADLKPDVQKEIEDVFEPNGGVKPVTDDNGNVTNWLVKVTNDITGPVVLPEGVSNIVINLNNHSITGLVGTTGTEGLPGGDGTPALVFSNAEVQVSIVGPGKVIGGDGGVNTYQTDIMYNGTGGAMDLDGDGAMEIYLTGDQFFDDYATWCLRYTDEGLKTVPFPYFDRSEITGEPSEYGYGRIVSAENGLLTLKGLRILYEKNVDGFSSCDCMFNHLFDIGILF